MTVSRTPTLSSRVRRLAFMCLCPNRTSLQGVTLNPLSLHPIIPMSTEWYNTETRTTALHYQNWLFLEKLFHNHGDQLGKLNMFNTTNRENLNVQLIYTT